MSSSSIYVMDKDFYGAENTEYRNSWWFTPVIWDVLLDKYLHDEIQTDYGYKKSLTGFDGPELFPKLNNTINECDNVADRICWEISNQQVFFTKDKELVANAIKEFARSNTAYHIHQEENKSVLVLDHIIERFEEIASDILAINEDIYPYFIFKNTSVDEGVESWFSKWDEEDDDSVERPLSKVEQRVTEFVVIENGTITHFINNLEYFQSVK